MPATYEKIATTTLGSATSSITFSSIAATYTDLRIVLTGTSSATAYAKMNFNGDTTGNYSVMNIYGDGASAYSTRNANETQIWIEGGYTPMSTTVPSFFAIDIFSYAGSTYKTCLSMASMDKNGSGSVSNAVGMWRNTAAITSIVLAISSGNFATGTTATLYGILKA